MVTCAACFGCAAEGRGVSPPLPVPATDSDASSVDDAGAPVDDANMPDGAAGGGICNDPLHGLKAIFVLPPMPCAASTDCPSGDCCYVNGSRSTCVMQ
jgi:hypothetical protein